MSLCPRRSIQGHYIVLTAPMRQSQCRVLSNTIGAVEARSAAVQRREILREALESPVTCSLQKNLFPSVFFCRHPEISVTLDLLAGISAKRTLDIQYF